MPHRNAPLTEVGRLRLARCVVQDPWPLRRAAERFQVAPTTAKRSRGPLPHPGRGRDDRSLQPTAPQPHRLPRRTERRSIKLRVAHRLGPARIAGRLGLHRSTVHRVLVRYRLPHLADCDRATAIPIRRYERAQPGELVHVDVNKLGRIPNGGGHRIHPASRPTATGRPPPPSGATASP